jgi:abequosyltransferase
MQPERPLLTIAIPTFKRAKYLRELLSGLYEQLIARSDVELLISDNSSPDETPFVVAEFIRRGLRIRALRNETNIGSDANFKQCFEQSSGKYVWVLGDDDLVVEGGIDKVIALLKARDYGVVYLGQYWFRNDPVAERTFDRFGRIAQILPGGLQLARKTGAMIGFLSAIIVNKDIFSQLPHLPLSHFEGTNLMQLGWVCPLLQSDSKCLIVWDRLVAARAANTGRWGICKVFGVNFCAIVNETLPRRKDIAKALETSSLQNWFPNMIMEIRQGTSSDLVPENMRDILEPLYKGNLSYWTHVFPLISFSLPIARVWFRIILFSRKLAVLFRVILDSMISRNDLILRSQTASGGLQSREPHWGSGRTPDVTGRGVKS